MKQHWNESELLEHWVLTDAEKRLLEQRTQGSTKIAVKVHAKNCE